LYSQTFPVTTPLDTIEAWRAQTKAVRAVRPIGRGSFSADIRDYLKRVSAMPTYGQRKQHLQLWLDALGAERPRGLITAAEIDEVMQGWLNAGTAPATVRKRRTALLACWNRLDGKDRPNPVRGSHAPPEPRPHARGLGYDRIRQVLAVMPASKTRARLAVMAWTGLPPSILQAITPADVNLKAKTLRVRPRRKGAGSDARVLTLLPQAVAALREFDRLNAYGKFTSAPMGVSFHRACRKLDPPLEDVKVYDLRHSFLTLLYRTTHDLATVARFGLHSSLSTTARYALGAVGDVDREAAKQAGRQAGKQAKG
jgi:integrase